MRKDAPGLALDGLDEERSNALAVSLERALKCVNVVVRDAVLHPGALGPEVWRERAKVLAGLGVGRHGDDRDSPAMEVAGDREDDGLVLWDALDEVAPFAREFERRLDRLGTGVHREDHLCESLREAGVSRELRKAFLTPERTVAEHVGDLLGERSELGRVECAGRERHTRGLVDERLDDLGVAVALVDGG